MTNNLKDMLRKKKVDEIKENIAKREDIARKSLSYVIPKKELWTSYINETSIKIFLNKLFEKCGNSPFEMQKWLDDFGLDDISIKNFSVEYDELMHQNEELADKICDLTNDIEIKEIVISELRIKNNTLRDEYDEFRKRNLSEVKKLKKVLKELRDNSVLFTMKDIEYL
jgi:hypothetical protein